MVPDAGAGKALCQSAKALGAGSDGGKLRTQTGRFFLFSPLCTPAPSPKKDGTFKLSGIPAGGAAECRYYIGSRILSKPSVWDPEEKGIISLVMAGGPVCLPVQALTGAAFLSIIHRIRPAWKFVSVMEGAGHR